MELQGKADNSNMAETSTTSIRSGQKQQAKDQKGAGETLSSLELTVQA